jgi:4-hydroxy-tetrahydrodipicolinate synthase
MRALFLEVNPIPIKAAMSMLGFCRDELRLPLVPMSEGPRETLRAALRAAGTRL